MIRDDLTAGTASANHLLLRDAPHGFVPEGAGEPGYRLRCAVPGCGRDRQDAAHGVPVPRGAAE